MTPITLSYRAQPTLEPCPLVPTQAGPPIPSGISPEPGMGDAASSPSWAPQPLLAQKLGGWWQGLAVLGSGWWRHQAGRWRLGA